MDSAKADTAPPAHGAPAVPQGVDIDATESRLAWRIVVLAVLGLAINANSTTLYAFGAPVSLLALSLSYVALTRLGPSIWHLYVLRLVVSAARIGTTVLVAWTYLTKLWFDRNRDLALVLSAPVWRQC